MTFYETVNIQCSIFKTFEISNFGYWDLPFDLAQGGELVEPPFDMAQGGESFDFAQDREPVERLVEPFGI